MNGIDFLADTNVLIYAMEENPAVRGLVSCSPAISIISEIEFLGKKDISEQEKTNIRTLLKGFFVISLTEEIKEITISLKQKYLIKPPDAIVAATAKYLGLPLITADKGFAKIEEINVIILNLQ